MSGTGEAAAGREVLLERCDLGGVERRLGFERAGDAGGLGADLLGEQGFLRGEGEHGGVAGAQPRRGFGDLGVEGRLTGEQLAGDDAVAHAGKGAEITAAVERLADAGGMAQGEVAPLGDGGQLGVVARRQVVGRFEDGGGRGGCEGGFGVAQGEAGGLDAVAQHVGPGRVRSKGGQRGGERVEHHEQAIRGNAGGGSDQQSADRSGDR